MRYAIPVALIAWLAGTTAASALPNAGAYQLRQAYQAHFIPRPIGCPARAFCGCGASVEAYGRSVRSLWLASAWFQFPHTLPAPGMAGVRRHHVFILRQHIAGSVWLVADYNSGGGRSRIHARSIAGYTIVNPHARQALL